MKLQTKFSLLMLSTFCVFMIAFWLVTQYWTARINSEWAIRLTETQVTFDMQRTLRPLLREINLAKQLAAEPAILNMALHENDASYRQRGIAVLESYRTQFQSQRYFAAFTQSQHCYAQTAKGSVLQRYALSHNNPMDAWFYSSIASPRSYSLNVEGNTHLKLDTQVWINHLIKQGDRTIGVVGTGISLKNLEQETEALEQQGIHSLWVDRALRIQLHHALARDERTKEAKLANPRLPMDAVFKRRSDVANLTQVVQHLLVSGEKSATLRVEYQGEPHLLGVRYVPELDWFAFTLMDAGQSRQLQQALSQVMVFGIIFLGVLLIVWFSVNSWVLFPLARLQHNMVVVEMNNSLPPLQIKGAGEIARLSRRFEKMVYHIRDYQANLEAKVLARTHDLDATLAAIPDALFEIDSWGMRQKIASNYSADIFIKQDAGVNESLFDLLPVEAVSVLKSALHEAQQTGLSRGHQFSLQVNSQVRWFELSVSLKPHLKGEEDNFIVLAHDVTLLKQAEEQIRSLAFYDVLTQLANRRLLNERLKQAMAASKRSGRYGALLFLDLDNFKPLNDAYGHEVGDQLLIEVAQRLTQCVRAVDTVARFGGDEFVVVLHELNEDAIVATQLALQVAEKIRLTLAAPYHLSVAIGNQPLRKVHHQCASSIGLSLIAPQQSSEETLLKEADSAMYQAKQQGRNRVCVYV